MLPHDEIGAGPALILLHAGIADRTMWAEHLGPLAEAGYRAIAVDIPGFGEAPVDEGGEAEWTAVLETMDALGVESAAIAGNSFGGAVACGSASSLPRGWSALALYLGTPSRAGPIPAAEGGLGGRGGGPGSRRHRGGGGGGPRRLDAPGCPRGAARASGEDAAPRLRGAGRGLRGGAARPARGAPRDAGRSRGPHPDRGGRARDERLPGRGGAMAEAIPGSRLV